MEMLQVFHLEKMENIYLFKCVHSLAENICLSEKISQKIIIKCVLEAELPMNSADDMS